MTDTFPMSAEPSPEAFAVALAIGCTVLLLTGVAVWLTIRVIVELWKNRSKP